ncbi:MAG TPA: SAF domain-containing protein [Nocardioides sp.]|nr:SAF domain-containing protein [Nocardioides sp.]
MSSDLSLGARLRDRLTAVRRAVLRRRRLLAVLLTAAAVGAGLHAASPPPPATVEVTVAARDLAAGVPLEQDDLTSLELPPGAVPAQAVAEPSGAVLAAPLRRGEPVTDVRLVGPALTDSAPGSSAVPVRLSDAEQAGLLSPGDPIALLATDPESGTTTTLASDVVVLAVPEDSGTSGDALTGRVVVLQVPGATVSQVVGAAATQLVTYAWADR